MICLKVADKDGKNITVAHGETEVYLALNHEYQEGDTIIPETEAGAHHTMLQGEEGPGKNKGFFNRWGTTHPSFWGEKKN